MNNKLVLIGVGIILLLILIVGAISLFFLSRRSSQAVTLTYWGLWEPKEVMEGVIADYQQTHPNVTINYIKQSPINYRERLTNALAGDSGPDIYRIHNTWVPMFRTQLAPVPSNIYSPASFQTTFYPTASQDLFLNGKPMAIPLEIDTLVLFINEDIFALRNEQPPTNWTEFRDVARRLVVRTGGRIQTAGAAMGTASNVDHWQDIVDLMMLQSGVNLNSEANSDKAQKALEYYTTFLSVDRVWDETLENSTTMFAQGRLAMYFAPSWRFFDIKTLNPNLKFKMIPVPQLPGADPVNFASYWAEGVNSKSSQPKQQAAFEFLQFLSSEESLTKLYEAETKIRGFGEPYSRVDMAGMLSSDPNAGVVIRSAPNAQSWYLVSFTNDGDTGINSRVGKYYLDAINQTRGGGDYAGVLNTVKAGLNQVLPDYGIPIQ